VHSKLLKLACKYLKVDDYVLHTYAAIMIDKILALRNYSDDEKENCNILNTPTSNNSSSRPPIPKAKPTYRYPQSELLKNISNLIPALFGTLQFGDSVNNEHVMKS